MRRRALLARAAGGVLATGALLAGWAFGVEPGWRLRLVRHRVASPGWPAHLPPITIACLADPHLGGPHTPPERLAHAVAIVNGLAPDMVVLLGDYLADHRWVTRSYAMADAAAVLAELRVPPLGRHVILGNHDWWGDPATRRGGLPRAAAVFAAAGLPVLHNDVTRLPHAGGAVVVGGLGSQWAIPLGRGRGHAGRDDLPGTLARIPSDGAPVILLAHEPDIFPRVPRRVALTLSGHTHGGQVRIAGWSPVVPSRFGNRYAWGHVEEEGRHLVVSGGIGQSILPVRFGMPPEITLVELGPAMS
jgi:predicted MPP superfamily phosphohydrolase